jgi:hypothetical protein
MELTIHTGCAGEETMINIDWFNENNVPQSTQLAIKVQDQDRPRQLEIIINGVKVAVVMNIE